MAEGVILTTERLQVRQWRDSDYDPFAALNADPEVMRYFPATLSRAESDEIADICRQRIHDEGFGFFATERRDTGEFIGFVGLHRPINNLPFTPCVETGWRLVKNAWGHGFATEAARACLDFGFGELGLEEIVSFTTVTNTPSRAVMERLGMTNTGRNFLYPSMEPDHPLAEHVLYSIRA